MQTAKRTEDIGRWSHLITDIEMKGLQSLPTEQLHAIIQQFQKERSNRLKINTDRQQAQRNAAKRRADEENRRLSEQEALMQKKLELDRVEKERKMNEWLDRARRRDKERATEKQNMKSLVEDQKKHSAANRERKADEASQPEPRSRPAQKNSKSINQQEPENMRKPSISTTRSAVAYYNSLAKTIDQVPDPYLQRYSDLMENSNYAQSIKLASSVYSRKMSIHA